MDLFLPDPEVVRQPPVDTRFLGLHAYPYPDGIRLKVVLELTPFLQAPYLEITLADSKGQTVSSTSIIEPASWKSELTLHIRKPVARPIGDIGSRSFDTYKLVVLLSYPDLGEVDRRELTVNIPSQLV